MKNRAIGFYFTLIACILAVVSIILYTQAMYTTPAVYVALVIAVVLVILGIVLNKKGLNTWLPVLVAALMGFAAAYSFYVMVNQIGYVVSGLDTIDTIYSFIAFVVVAIIGMLFAMIGGFLKQQKDE